MGVVTGGGGGGWTKPSQWTVAAGGQLAIAETNTNAALLELLNTSPTDVFVVDADGGVSITPQLHGTLGLNVAVPASADTGVAEFKIGGARVAVIGGNDNIGVANLHVDPSGNDGVQPLLNVGGALGATTGLICAQKGASPAAGKLGFYGAAVASRPAAPVTLGDVIAALQTLGLVGT